MCFSRPWKFIDRYHFGFMHSGFRKCVIWFWLQSWGRLLKRTAEQKKICKENSCKTQIWGNDQVSMDALSSLEQVQPEIHSCAPSGSDLLFSSQASWPLTLLLLPCPAEPQLLLLYTFSQHMFPPVFQRNAGLSSEGYGLPGASGDESFICWGSTHHGTGKEHLS